MQEAKDSCRSGRNPSEYSMSRNPPEDLDSGKNLLDLGKKTRFEKDLKRASHFFKKVGNHIYNANEWDVGV